MSGPSKPAGHAFISYVREDSHLVDRLQQVLETAGIPVWRDTADLWPGEDWRKNIRRAITDDALAFVACFSQRSLSRDRSYQNEELVLAVEQLRLRRSGDPWLIPVRFDDCDIPDRDLGGGRTLASIQRVDLFGDRADKGAERLVAAIQRILDHGSRAGRWQSSTRGLSSGPPAPAVPRAISPAPHPTPALLPWPSHLVRTLTGHTNKVNSIAFSSDSRKLATASEDGTAQLWDSASGQHLHTINADRLKAVAFSSDDRMLGTGGRHAAQLWDPGTGELLATLPAPGVFAVAFSPDGKLLAVGGARSVQLWNPITGKLLNTLKGPLAIVKAVAFSPDSRLMAASGDHESMQLWDPLTGNQLRTLKLPFTTSFVAQRYGFNAVAFSPDGHLLASAGKDNKTRLWDPATGQLVRTFKGHTGIFNEGVLAVAFSSDGQVLATGGDDQRVLVWDPIRGKHLGTLTANTGILHGVRAVAFSPDGHLLASTSYVNVRLWS